MFHSPHAFLVFLIWVCLCHGICSIQARVWVRWKWKHFCLVFPIFTWRSYLKVLLPCSFYNKTVKVQFLISIRIAESKQGVHFSGSFFFCFTLCLLSLIPQKMLSKKDTTASLKESRKEENSLLVLSFGERGDGTAQTDMSIFTKIQATPSLISFHSGC